MSRSPSTSWFGGDNYIPDRDIPDLSDKVILVTGGNTGLGKETILQLSKHNPAIIYLAARTKSKADDAISSLQTTIPPNSSTKIVHLPLDLTSFESITSAAQQFLSQSSRLDLLINNAGVMAQPFSTTKEGYEIQLGTNHLGHALLTKFLLPTMLKTAEEHHTDVRIVNVTSEGQNFAAFAGSRGAVFETEKLEKCSTWTRYGVSKLANVLYTKGLKQRYGDKITCVSCHPGVIETELYTAFRGTLFGKVLMNSVVRALRAVVFRTVSQGAYNQLWCATGPKEAVRKGFYFVPVAVESNRGWLTSQENVDTLWNWTEEQLGKHGV